MISGLKHARSCCHMTTWSTADRSLDTDSRMDVANGEDPAC